MVGRIWQRSVTEEIGLANLMMFGSLFEKIQGDTAIAADDGGGLVIHVVVTLAYDFSKLLRRLTLVNAENLRALTPAYAGETSIGVNFE